MGCILVCVFDCCVCVWWWECFWYFVWVWSWDGGWRLDEILMICWVESVGCVSFLVIVWWVWFFCWGIVWFWMRFWCWGWWSVFFRLWGWCFFGWWRCYVELRCWWFFRDYGMFLLCVCFFLMLVFVGSYLWVGLCWFVDWLFVVECWVCSCLECLFVGWWWWWLLMVGRVLNFWCVCGIFWVGEVLFEMFRFWWLLVKGFLLCRWFFSGWGWWGWVVWVLVVWRVVRWCYVVFWRDCWLVGRFIVLFRWWMWVLWLLRIGGFWDMCLEVGEWGLGWGDWREGCCVVLMGFFCGGLCVLLCDIGKEIEFVWF